MTETFEPFQVTVKAQPRPMAYGTLPTSPQPTPPSVMWYNVKTMYGADNSGNIDSTQVIQNAINAANTAGGGVVYFPPGTYRISAALRVYGGSQLRGDGDANTIIRQYTPNVGCFTGIDIYQFKLSNIQLLGTGAGTGKGILFTLGSYSNTGFLHFEDVFIQKFGGDAIDIDTPQSSVFDRVITQGNGGNGWNTHSGTVATSCTWNACFSKGNGAAGFTHTNLSYSSMNGCSSTGNRTAYILTNCQSVVLDSPGADSNVGDNFIISGGVGNVLIAPRVYQNNSYGIHLTANAKNCVIVGAYDNTPLAGVINFIATDAGTSCTIINVNNTTANLYNGSVNVLDDGSGNVTTPGLLTAGGVDTTGLSTASVSKTGSYTLTLNDNVVLCNATSGAFTVTLPNATAPSVRGTIFLIKKTDASVNAVTLAAVGGQTIDGRATATLTTQYALVAVQSDGANWQIVGGASSTTIASGMVGWYNVRLYGADNTGAADSVTAINNAVNAAGAAGGGIVYFPPGKYMLSNQINLNGLNNVTLLGDGQASVLLPVASFPGGTVINVIGGDSNAVNDLVIQMASSTIASNTTQFGICAQNNTSNFRSSNVKVMYANNYGIMLRSGCLFPVIEKAHTYNCLYGIGASGTPAVVQGAVLYDCIIEGAGGTYGLVVTDYQDIQINNLYVNGISSASVIIQGASNGVTLSNSKLISLSTSQANLLIQAAGSNSPTNVAVSNTIMSKGANCCNVLHNSKQVSFSNCMFTNALGHGLYTANSADQVVVTGCTFSGNGQNNNTSYDIYAGAAASTIVVTGNQFLSPVGTVTGTLAKSIIFNIGAAVYSVCDCNYFAGGQGTSWPAGSAPRLSVGNSGDPWANQATTPNWFDVRRYGANGANNSGVDSTAAIQAAVNAAGASYGGGVVYIPPGWYNVSAPITNTKIQVTIQGDPSASTYICPTAAFSGAAVFLVTGANYCSINNLYIQFNNGTWSNNPVADGIQVAHSMYFKSRNVYVVWGNGYGITLLSDATGATSFATIENFYSSYSKGGINLQGVAGTDTQGIATIVNCWFNNPQASPAINVQDYQYVNIDNCLAWGNQNSGLYISGAAAFVTATNCTFGSYGAPNGNSLGIVTAGGNTPTDIYITNCIFQSGQSSQVNSGNRIFITNCQFSWCQTHGLYFAGGCDQIRVSGCVFFNNGRTAGAGHYDLCYNATGNISISGCQFVTGIGTGNTQVQTSIFVNSNTTVYGNRFWGAQGTAVTGTPTYFFGNLGDTGSSFNNIIGQTVQAGPISGATNAGRFVGSTGPGGPPGGGTYRVSDFVVDAGGQVYVCTAAGTPGTWVGTGPFTVVATANPSYVVPNDNVAHNIVGAVVTINVQPGWDVLVNWSSYGQIFEGNTAAHAVLSVGLYIDGALSAAPAAMMAGRNASVGNTGMLSNLWKFSGLSAGNHTFQLICQWNGTVSQAGIYQSTISATCQRPPM